jgi:hypothetical protein
MKTKTIITAMAVAAALAAGTQAVKANSFLEVISGDVSVSTTGPVLTTGALPGWIISVDTGSAADAPLNIDLGSYDSGFSPGPLEVIFSTGTYPQHGGWALNTVSSSTPGVGVVANAYSTGGLNVWQNVPAYGGSVTTTGSISNALGVYTEDIWITPVAGFNSVSVDSFFTLCPVPDGGMTLMLLGSAFAGLAGIRSKLAKRG